MSARRAHAGPRHGALGRSLWTASALLVCGGAALLAPSAEAGFTPSALVSGSQQIGADYAFDPAFAADGRYVVYGGSQGTTAGVYRKDLAAGTLELVAAGDAGAPSVSADGRWVAFTSSARLGSADEHAGACTSVYVRDMSLPATDPAAYLLASARDGSDAGLTYADAGVPGCPGGGADAAARGAISADGRKVAFTVIGASDLLGAAGDATTAEAQIAVRDLAMRTTQLVSQTRDSLGGVPAAVDGGAALSSSKRVEARNRPVARSSATISADGTTVAWMGIQIPQQAPIGDRFTRQPPGTGPRWYAEPLWRRIADGPTAPTRRIVGGSDDPEACPSCDGPLIADFAPDLPPPDGPDPLAGSFIFVPSLGGGSLQNASTIEAATPRMSADGRRVAVLSTQPGHEERQAAGSGGSIAATANAFVVDMAPGLTRTQALTRLTRWASIRFGQGNENVSGPVTSVAISPDGTRVAFTTNRIVFTQSPPGLITPPLSQLSATELYQVNLTAGTLALASTGYDGAPADGDLATPSYAGDSRTLTFAGTASNLVYGAVNGRDNTAVFKLAETASPEIPGEPTVPPAPMPHAARPRWVLSATARRGKNGSMLVDVAVPGSGRLTAAATAAVPITTRRRVRVPVRGRAATRGRTRVVTRTVTAIVRRTVAHAAGRSRTPGVVRLRLTPASRYRPLAGSRTGLDATIAVTFSASGRPRLTTRLQVRFAAVRRTSARRPTRRSAR